MTKPIKLTPMLQQYLEIKEANKDAILFYRMGDFYEMFFEDAKIASKALGITLTSRNKKNDDNQVPMCGIPYHAAETYLAKLVKAGHRVAICEQTEDPAAAKGIVKREVIRTLSSGVITDNKLLDDKSNNYLAAVCRAEHQKKPIFGVSFLDLSTGEFLTGEFLDSSENVEVIVDQMTRMTPAELLVNESDMDNLSNLLDILTTLLPGLRITERASSLFHFPSCTEILQDHFKVVNLSGFGCEDMQKGIIASGVLLDYIQETQKSDIDHIERLSPIDLETVLLIDDSSRRNLELTQTIVGGSREGSLLSVIDHTSTPMGARLLKHHILFPLQDVTRINNRLDAVNFLYQNSSLRQELKDILSSIQDIERLNSRMVLGTGNGRDLLALKSSLARLPELHQLLEQCTTIKFQEITENFDNLSDLHALLEQAINEEAPVTLRDGNLIKTGYNNELDELVVLMRDGKKMILELEAQEREATGIAKLKIGFNKVFGYFLEVSKINADKVPEHYIRKQTLVNAERFITPELKDFETKVLTAQDRRLEMEYGLFLEIRNRLASESPRLLKIANLLAQIDLFSSFSETAHRFQYRRPTVEEGSDITILEGRHPVIERSLPSGKFVPNDVHLDQNTNEVLIITGPNMAGKSTILRQTALIVLMAQMGSFVPADAAKVGVVDRIFTRVGAMDDLRRGQSTFMVEMNETANILNNATDKSLVILDEIGRGTSTYDGLAIAWAVAEELVTKNDIGVKTLFATHYHELTDLAKNQRRVQNYSIAVREWNDTIIFLHKLVEGGTNRSYGIQVAGLAGVPNHVVIRANEILKNIENGELGQVRDDTMPTYHSPKKKSKKTNPNQLSLFQPPADPLRTQLEQINPDDLSPRQALETLYILRDLLN
jgi:DNA mismatch repair protein MutS